MAHVNFARTARQAQEWVHELAADLGWNERRAYRLFKAVLQTLRDWLPPEEMADLSAQLPVLVRGIFFDGWNPSASPARERSKQDFVANVRKQLGFKTDIDLDIDIDRAVSAVFNLLDRHIAHGEIAQVRNSMKKQLRHLWPGH